MPFVRRNGVRIHYEVAGSGPALLLLEGLGYGLWMWSKQRPALARHFTLVMPDHRGNGQSDKPDEPYTIRLLAEDALAVLNELGMERAHVLGVSLGGMVALELAVYFPERVRGLVLASTTPGGPHADPMPRVTQEAWLAARTLPPREGLRAAMALAFGSGYMETHPDEVEWILTERLRAPQPDHAWLRQLQAAWQFDVFDALGGIEHPALVIAGSEDRVVPTSNAHVLAGRIPNARLVVFEGAGHLVFWERAEEFNAEVIRFLREVDRNEVSAQDGDHSHAHERGGMS